MTQSEDGSRIRALVTGTGRYVPDDVWTSDMVEARVDGIELESTQRVRGVGGRRQSCCGDGDATQ